MPASSLPPKIESLPFPPRARCCVRAGPNCLLSVCARVARGLSEKANFSFSRDGSAWRRRVTRRPCGEGEGEGESSDEGTGEEDGSEEEEVDGESDGEVEEDGEAGEDSLPRVTATMMTTRVGVEGKDQSQPQMSVGQGKGGASAKPKLKHRRRRPGQGPSVRQTFCVEC
eukprot:scaffold36304_cov121-Isochrysis_galbana.AAC.7